MKYHTIGTSSVSSENKSSFTVYANMDISPVKMYSEKEVQSIRGELEIVQKALRLQTKRCRKLVAEYTRRLQEKEHQYISEKALRDDQLAKVLKALLIFETRLRQEQKFITKQLNEKDLIIKKQRCDIKKLLLNQYCKNCSQYYASSPVQESLDSSTEYVLTDCQDYQSSNFESLDSSETNATCSEKDFNKSESSCEGDSRESETKSIYQKNPNKDSLGRRSRKIPHRKSIGTYFEVLKMRNDSSSPLSNEDNTSNDYDNLDSLPNEHIDNKITTVTENIKEMFEKTHQIIVNNDNQSESKEVNEEGDKKVEEKRISQISESIPVFECGEEPNENWYASASDQEDDEHRNIYRNNPVLECMNQILLQNINDTLNSPPKTPNTERKPVKNKRVTFSDEENKQESQENILKHENLTKKEDNTQDYYETPIQNSPNFYETPQSIYSNDYEQILSKCTETFSSEKNNSTDHYVDMDEKKKVVNNEINLTKKSKILRPPPALPPKPLNLVSKYKMGSPKTPPSERSLDGEPDYCSISELNLPQNKSVSFNKINVVAEINAPTSLDVVNKLNANDLIKNDKISDGEMHNLKENMVVKKCVEKMNIQLAKQTTIKSESTSPKKKEVIDIPKLPHVSEILIPESEDDEKDKEEIITQDNYMRNNTQILKLKTTPKESPIRKPLVMGSTVSSLISTFNSQQLLNEIKHSPDKNKSSKTLFSNFEHAQNLERKPIPTGEAKSPNFEKFDLSQNFEEFKLDDCEIEEYTVEEVKTESAKEGIDSKVHSTRVDVVRATKPVDVITPTLSKNAVQLFKKHLEIEQNKPLINIKSKGGVPILKPNEPTYEHFLECTGLSTKSLLTPSRILDNNKNALKARSLKIKPAAKSNLFEKHTNTALKYWSEPYL